MQPVDLGAEHVEQRGREGELPEDGVREQELAARVHLGGDVALEGPGVEDHQLAGPALAVEDERDARGAEMLAAIVQLAGGHLQGVEIDAVEAGAGKG